MDLADKAAFAHLALRIRAGLAHFGRLEDLHAIVAAIADVEQTVVGQLGAMHRAAEELRFHVAGLEIVRPGACILADIFTRRHFHPSTGFCP